MIICFILVVSVLQLVGTAAADSASTVAAADSEQQKYHHLRSLVGADSTNNDEEPDAEQENSFVAALSQWMLPQSSNNETRQNNDTDEDVDAEGNQRNPILGPICSVLTPLVLGLYSFLDSSFAGTYTGDNVLLIIFNILTTITLNILFAPISFPYTLLNCPFQV